MPAATPPDLGSARVGPKRIYTAGSYDTVRFTYTVGHPVDDSGYIKIVFRNVGDFGRPQFDDPEAPDYCTVQTTGDCRIAPRWDPKGHTRPWSKALLLQVSGGFLNRGERVTVIFGNRAGGSPGWRMQSFCEHTFEFKTLVDPYATYQFKELPRCPVIRIVAGKAVRAVCIAPSQVRVGERFSVLSKTEDRWGNPTHRPKRQRHAGFQRPGIERITVQDPRSGLPATSNPIEVVADQPALQCWWADFHGQTEETVGTNTIDDYFTFARDVAGLDIAAHQGNDFQVTDDFWTTINRTTRRFDEPGRFVTFPGYEWSGNTPLGGDRNVYFAGEGGKITRSCRDLLPGGASLYPDSPTARDLFRTLKQQRDPAAFAFAHVGGRYADLAMHDPELELAVEIHSAWGTFEWLLDEALRRGYRVGVCANSDGHKCRPGAAYPGAGAFGSLGGLTGVLAERLDRRHVVEALRARHVYATTGHRPLLDVAVVTADGRRAIMGDVIRCGAGTPVLHVRATGTADIDAIEVRNGLHTIRTLRPFGEQDLGKRIKVAWSGAEVRGRARMACWDGGLQVAGNRIRRFTPINLWNPARPMRRVSANQLAWQSVTTGGAAGVILELDRPLTGTLQIETASRCARCEVRTIGLHPRTWAGDGLRKQLQVWRLPARPAPKEFAFTLPLHRLHRGDNAIYVRLSQEDGHLAWSSPIYITG